MLATIRRLSLRVSSDPKIVRLMAMALGLALTMIVSGPIGGGAGGG